MQVTENVTSLAATYLDTIATLRNALFASTALGLVNDTDNALIASLSELTKAVALYKVRLAGVFSSLYFYRNTNSTGNDM